MRRTVFIAAAVGLFFVTRPLLAIGPEEILSFDSDITVREDGSMSVRETIRVRAAGKKIRRGIYRDFPTRYRDRAGNNYVVGFNVRSVLRDGRPEPYHVANISNGRRVYIGRRNSFIPPGEYTYTIVYDTDRQLGFFGDHDELYWNVTGNGWAFPIQRASATVRLPEGIPGEEVRVEGYTGPQGSKAKNLTAGVGADGRAKFATTEKLGPREGLTIVVGWPKGFVREPTRAEKLGYFARDNAGTALGLTGLAALFLYYLAVWAKVGKDPARGTIIPLYRPPERLSPAAARYVTKMGYDNKAFSAAVVDMAVKGFLKIREENKVYTLEKVRDDATGLSREEKKIAAKLFGSRREIELKQKNHSKIGKAVEAVKKTLKAQYEKSYFVTNRRYFVPGVLISVATLVVSALSAGRRGGDVPVLFMAVWLTIWTIGVIALLAGVVTSLGGVRSGGSVSRAVVLSLFALPFLAGEVLGIAILIRAAAILLVFILIAVAVVNILFYHLLKAPTRAGRKLLDLIEGFAMYLGVAERDRLDMLEPRKTPELFERYLPYALALDVENRWAEKFSDVLARASRAGEEYSPAWYSGRGWSTMGSRGFAASVGGALSSAIASSSTAPGSSSGFSGGGGGGSSGGGGGGGGGGGW